MLRVSLLASTYRSERFLGPWLRSIEELTIWPEAELVVIANDPQPAERELLHAFAGTHDQARVVEVEREPLYRSWNRAIAASQAPLLAIANVDDLRTPGGLAAQVAALEQDDGALFAYGPFTVVRTFPPDGAPGLHVPAEPFDREAFTRGMHAGPFVVWRRTEQPATLWFDEQLRVAADFDLIVRLSMHGTGVPVAEDLGFYYDGGTGLSTEGSRQQIEKAVLELRYGIYDKIDYERVADAAAYRIPDLQLPGGEWLPVAEAVPDYERFLADRRARWHARGLAHWRSPWRRAWRGARNAAIAVRRR